MNRYKADILDHFVSSKVLAGPSATVDSTRRRSLLAADPLYRELRARLDAIGFFTPAPWSYAWRVAINLALCTFGWIMIVLAESIWLSMAGAVAVGVTMIQSSVLAHDAAHGALTRRSWLVELVGQLHGTVIAGFAFTYFRRSHDLHHSHTNEHDLDPDCLSEVFSVERGSASRKTGFGRFLTRHQAVLIPLMFPLWALAMKCDGLGYIARGWRRCWRDIVAMLLHVVCWLVLPLVIGGPLALVCYLGANMIAGIYLGAVIPVNHVATTYLTSTHALSFVEHQLATCRNIRSPRTRLLAAVFGFLFLGLDRQIEHHLFPWAPACRLAKGSEVVREVCRERGLPYNETSYRRAVCELASHFARIGRAAKLDAAWRLSSETPPV